MTAVMHFSVDGIWSHESVLGQERQVLFEDRVFTFTLPESSEAFMPECDESAWSTWSTRTESGTNRRAEVTLVRVRVELPELQLGAERSPADDLEVLNAMDAAAASARRLISAFLVDIAVRLRQSQFARANTVPPRMVGGARLFDASGTPVPLGISHGGRLLVRAERPPLTVESWSDALTAVELGERPSMPQQLLAEAEFQAWHSEDTNHGLAIFLAAVAAETAIKRYMDDQASPEQRPLVQLLISSPRDFSLAASTLYDKGLKAITDRSLRERDKELFKGVDLLFRHRNLFAHGSPQALSTAEVSADLAAARGAIDYLKALNDSD